VTPPSISGPAISAPGRTDPGIVRRVLGAALDVLLPPRCAACDEPVGAAGELCAACFGAMDFAVDPACRRCALPFASASHGGADGACAVCRARPPA
jgi:predicted amidophosphoribosyltransferase